MLTYLFGAGTTITAIKHHLPSFDYQHRCYKTSKTFKKALSTGEGEGRGGGGVVAGVVAGMGEGWGVRYKEM